jgi:outer membrane immunogenic protein
MAVVLLTAMTAATAAPGDSGWGGFYVGADAGNARTRNTATWTPLPNPQSFFALGASGNDGGHSFAGGLHAGYNWNFAPAWVAGAEADVSLTHVAGSMTVAPWIAPTGAITAPASSTRMSAKLANMMLLRARFGLLVKPTLLAYATGGPAWARIDYAANNGNSFTGATAYTTDAAASKTQTGYVLGAGLEWAVTGKWLLRGEYLYYRFNDGPSVTAQDTKGNFPGFPSGYSWGSTKANVLQVGLSYKF